MFSPRLVLGSAIVVGACVVAACGASSTTSDHTGGQPAKTVTIVETQTVGLETAGSPPLTTPSSTPSTTTTTTTGTQTGTTTTATTTTPVAGTAACVAADLRGSFLGTNGAAGTIAVGFALKNTSSAACHTYGWPGVLLLSSTGAALPTDAVRTSSDMLGTTAPTDIVLAPGQEASFRVIASDFAEGGGASCANATILQVIPPDDTATLKINISGGIPACGKATLSPLMTGTSAWPSE
jgi:hypothetical protein